MTTAANQSTRYITVEASVYAELIESARSWKERAEKAEARAEKAEARVRVLEAQVSQLIARVNQLEHELYGKKSEKGKPEADAAPKGEAEKQKDRPKKQSGTKRPDRRSHDHLPLEVVEVDLPEDEKKCLVCGEPFKDFPGREEGETIEIEVRAHRRKIRRRQYMQM